MNKFSIKESIDNSIFKTYNVLSNFMFRFINNKEKNLIKNNINLKNIHQGKRCFILGTGPSLKSLNPEYLKDEITFGVNYLNKSEIAKYINPNYYCLFDNRFYNEDKEYMKNIINQFPDTKFIVRTKAYDTIKELGLDENNIYYQYMNIYQYNDIIKVDMCKNMTACMNVVLGCIQSAIYMGFKEIYLLGCDFNSFASPKVIHCYDNNDSPDRVMSVGFELKCYSTVAYHHYALKAYADKLGIKIYNATPNSLLDAYEYINIDSIR